MARIIVLILAVVCVSCQSLPIVQEVLSADTVILNDGTKVRYAGIESPDKNSPYFQKCLNDNAYLVKGKSVIVIPEPELSTDEVTVAYVRTPVITEKGTFYLFVNAELSRFGRAIAQKVPEKGCVHKELWQMIWDFQENEAKPLGLGIWEKQASNP